MLARQHAPGHHLWPPPAAAAPDLRARRSSRTWCMSSRWSLRASHADQLKLTYRLSGDLDALQTSRSHAAGAHRRTLAAQLLRSLHRPQRRGRLLGIQLLAVGRLGGLSLHRLPRRNGAAADRCATGHRPEHRAATTVELAVSLDLSWLARSVAGRGLRLGLAAVVEDKARVLSYWALKHPAEKPDFHHADSFVVELD